jgi:HEAT repeat protein
MSPCPVCQKPVDPLRARSVGVRDGRIVAYCSPECQARAAALGGGPEAAASAAAAVTTAASAASAAPALAPAPASAPVPAAAAAPAPAAAAALAAAAPPSVEPAPSGKRTRTASGKAARTTASSVPAAAAPPAEAAAPPAGSGSDRRITATAVAAAAAAAESSATPSDDLSASGVRRLRKRMDNLAADSAWDSLDDEDEPAEPVGPRRRQRAEGERGGPRLLLILLVLAVLGGGGYAVYRFVLQKPGGGAAAPADAAPPDGPPADAAPTPEQQRASAIERATGVLRAYAKDEAPAGEGAGAQALARRMAVGALSRTGDAEAIATLAGLLDKEQIESARLEIAYDLARAGDRRGTDRLVAALAHKNVEHRYEAARWLALLGDQRAVPVLNGAMAFGQLRLQAAGVLAYLANPNALKLLEQIRAVPGATDEDKAKATIALGRAKKATADELRALLSDKRNAEAATVLAELGDVTAKPALYEQLGFEHSRVEAARALRRFGDEGDQLDGLPTLLAALGGDGATARIRAAEAILLLAGPASWSERM